MVDIMTNPPMPDDKSIRLDQFLKVHGITDTGGRAKVAIQNGEIKVNGTPETKRRRKLVAGDIVEFEGAKHRFDG